MSFAYTILVVRLLGEHVYGQYVTILSFVGLFGVFFELGVAQYVERSVAQDRTRLPGLFWMLIIIRMVLALIGIVALTAAALALGYDSSIVLGVLLFTTTFILAAVLVAFQTIFTSHEQYHLWTAGQVVGQVGTIVFGLLVLWLGGGVLGLIAIGLAAMLLQIAFAIGGVRRIKVGALPFRFDLHEVPAFLRACLPFGLTSLALTITMNVDTFILSLLQPSNVVGWYSAAYRLVPTVVSILGGFLTVITPSLARVYVSDPEAVRGWTRSSIKWLAMFAIPAATGVSLLAIQIIDLLYGTAYAPSGMILAVIAWDIPLRLFNAFAGNVTAAVGLERPAWRIYMTGALLGVVFYPPAILTSGMLGAAVITVVTDGINAGLFLRLLSKHMQMSKSVPMLLRVSGAAAVMGAAVVVLNQYIALPLTILGGGLIYAILARALGLIDTAMMVRVGSWMGRRLQRRAS